MQVHQLSSKCPPTDIALSGSFHPLTMALLLCLSATHASTQKAVQAPCVTVSDTNSKHWPVRAQAGTHSAFFFLFAPPEAD